MKNRVMQMFRQYGLLNNDNDKILELGLTRFLNGIMDLIFTMFCAYVLGNVLVGVCFEGCYIVLRIYAGGYHTATRRRCFILTYISSAICIIASFTIPLKYLYIILIIADILIVIKAPVESENKPLNRLEYKVYRRITICMVLCYSGMCVCFLKLKWHSLAMSICMALSLVAAGLIAEKND